jgi:3',5'-cyclic AMP phosphodiesterase CpdA
MKESITVLHLSDLHFGHGQPSHQMDQRLVLLELVSDVRTVASEAGLVVDTILVTGDIAFSGGRRKTSDGQQEYKKASDWFDVLQGSLAHLGVRPQILCVPGNHDVDRRTGGESKAAAFLDGRGSRTPVDDLLSRKSCRQGIVRRFSRYTAWASSAGCVQSTDIPGHWERLIRRGNILIRIVGLNTSLLSHGDDDFGHLQVGKGQLAAALDSFSATFAVAIGHHPISGGWLADEIYCQPALQKSIDIYLHGHIHTQGSHSEASPASEGLVIISAGASHAAQSEPPTHSYQLITFEVDSDGRRSIAVLPRRWVVPAFSYRSDAEVSGGRNDGTMVYHLPGTAAVKHRGTQLLADAGAFLDLGLVEQGLTVLRGGRNIDDFTPEERFEWLLIHQKFGRLSGIRAAIDEWLEQGTPNDLIKQHLNLLRLKVLSQEGACTDVVKASEELAADLSRLGQDHLVAQVYHREGLSHAALGAPECARESFEKALAAGRNTRNHHQMNTTRFLWALCAGLAEVPLTSDMGAALDEVVSSGTEYARAPLAPALWQAGRLKSAVHSLFVEGSILLREPGCRDAGLVRLLVGHALIHGTGANPASEGFAEHLRLLAGSDRELVQAAMSPLASGGLVEGILMNRLLVRLARGAFETIQGSLAVNWMHLRRRLEEIDQRLL